MDVNLLGVGVDVCRDQPLKALHDNGCHRLSSCKHAALFFFGSGMIMVVLNEVGISDRSKKRLKMSVNTTTS